MNKMLKIVSQILLYPWGIWALCAWFPNVLKKRIGRARLDVRVVFGLMHFFLYVFVGLPLTVLLTGEILIQMNDWAVGEQANYRSGVGRMDWSKKETLAVPGPKIRSPKSIANSSRKNYHSYLLDLYSPVILQKLSFRPEWDIPVFIDFDGNKDPRDNVKNASSSGSFLAGVYAEVTAETKDSYYLTYSLYHIKDYDHPVREVLSSWTYHDNDNEGFMIRVDKKTMKPVEAECWYHNRFFLCNNTGSSEGTEPIQGLMHFEEGTHLILYAQPMGHGVRCAQEWDQYDLDSNIKILRFRNDANQPPVPVSVNQEVQVNGTYDIESFDWWYEQARGPFGEKGGGNGLFEEKILLGELHGQPLFMGRFIAGWDYAKDSWSRPKPPWSWDDGWDEIPIVTWHLFPSYAFQSHMGSRVSHTYLSNEPVEKIFNMKTEELYRLQKLQVLYREGDKWSPLTTRGDKPSRQNYWKAMQFLLKRYINYLFLTLG